jgi:hypothetical protein
MMSRLMHAVLSYVRILLFSIAAAIAYGIIHDQITAHVCVEYFTIGHPPVFPTDSPTLLAFGWGVIATWWVGAILGVSLAIVSRAGSRPKLSVRDLCGPVIVLLGMMGAVALAAGIVGYVLAERGAVWLMEPLSSQVPPDKHVAFLADLWAHNASYTTGFVGGIVLCISTWRRRGRLRFQSEQLRERTD